MSAVKVVVADWRSFAAHRLGKASIGQNVQRVIGNGDITLYKWKLLGKPQTIKLPLALGTEQADWIHWK